MNALLYRVRLGQSNCQSGYRKLRLQVTSLKGHLSKGSFVHNQVVQIQKFDAKPNPNSDLNPNPDTNPNPKPMPICFGQRTLWTSELS